MKKIIVTTIGEGFEVYIDGEREKTIISAKTPQQAIGLLVLNHSDELNVDIKWEGNIK